MTETKWNKDKPLTLDDSVYLMLLEDRRNKQ